MTEIVLLDPVYTVVNTIYIIVLLQVSFIYIYFSMKQENSIDKKFLIIMAIFVGYYMLVRIVSFNGDHYLIGEYVGHSYVGSWENAPELYNISHTIAYAITSIGWTCGAFIFESEFKRSRHIFTILGCISITSILINKSLTLFINTALGMVNFGVIIAIGKNAKQELRYITNNLALGFGIMAFGLGIDGRLIKELDLINISIPVILMTVGVIIAILPFFLKPEANKMRRAIPAFLISMITIISCNYYFIIISIQQIIPYFIVGCFIFDIILFYALINTYLYIKPDSGRKKTKRTDSDDSLLTTFIRPQKITEEEVSVSKEKRTCLVCKSVVGGNMFMCKECGAFYCEKCSSTLANMENACWACEAPFDESKPVNLPKKDEEDLEIEAPSHKEMKKKS